MPRYDVILLHPPSLYDFRERVVFPGPFAASVEQAQFNKVPIGMLSIADYLDRNGCRVIIDNLCDRMIIDKAFDVTEHLKGLNTRILAVGMHFQQHSQGALKIAHLYKELHPDALVVLGGLTATCFHDEIIRTCGFVDAVIRAEGEKPLLQLVQSLRTTGKLGGTPNLTWRGENNEIASSPLMSASTDLDEFEFTRFDLIEPKSSIYPEKAPPRWSLAVCRGCLYNCAICGGSSYSYKTYMGMNRPAFRSPAKIISDIKKLNSQGISFVGLYQDPRMGGEKYWRELLTLLAGNDIQLERLSIDLLVPADEEFIKAVAAIGRQVVIHLCPDTGCDAVRAKLGRPYTNEELLECVRLCHDYGLPVTTFFSVGLAEETVSQVADTRMLWEELSSLDKGFQVSHGVPVGGPIVGPILVDPGSLAFDRPEHYGYRLLYKTLAEYIEAFSTPSWHHWLNYETTTMNSQAIRNIILETVRFSIDQRYAAGFYDDETAIAESARTTLDRVLVEEVDKIMLLSDESVRDDKLRELKQRYESFLNLPLETIAR